MQRLHDDDLSGTLLRSPEKWVQLKLAAIAEEEQIVPIGHNKYHVRHVGDVLHAERTPRSFLESLRSLDPDTFAAHYQQTPLPRDGLIVQRKWVRHYDELPSRKPSSLVIQSWDTASKTGEANDWLVCTTWLLQDKKYYLIHVLRDRLDYPSLRTRAIAHARAYAGLVRSKVRIGTERPTAELTPARSIRIVEKVTLWAIAKYQSSVGRHHHIRPSKVIALEQQRG